MYAHPSHEMSEETTEALRGIEERLTEIEKKLSVLSGAVEDARRLQRLNLRYEG